jgi:hypothetical protein
VLTVLLNSAVLLSPFAHGLEFEIDRIPLASDQQIAFMPFVSRSSDTQEILVIETPPVRTVRVFRLADPGSWRPVLEVELNAAMDMVDTFRHRDGISFAGFQASQLLVLNVEETAFEPLLSAGSMYVGVNWDASPTFDMFRDLNGDELDDFLMPDFDGWQVALQQEEGFSTAQSLGPSPQMNFGETSQFVGYQAETPHQLDGNQDGLLDLAFWLNGRFEVYLQKPDGSFEAQPVIVDPGLPDVLGDFLSVSLDEGEDGEESDPQRTLDAVDDINADGLSDLIIQTMEGDGIFGLETRYEIHRGMVGEDERLTFEPSASSTVSSDGIQLDNERLDLTGDGKQEFVVTSVNISLGSIIAALITRSASVDVSIYQMTDGLFPDEPSLEKEIKVRFDFGAGELFVPAVLSADVTGDGRHDLLVQKDLETLFVYPGEATDRLFAKSPIKLEMALPQEREGFVVTDLDHDGRDELILHVRREDSSSLAVVHFKD